jgi:hypothetical protein
MLTQRDVNGMKRTNGSLNGLAGAKEERPERHPETVALDPKQYDELQAYLSSDASGDPSKLLAFFATTETVHR